MVTQFTELPQSSMHWVTNVLHHANHISIQNYYVIKVDIRHCGTLFTTMISYTLVSSHSGLLRELLCLLHIITIVGLTYAITNRQKYYISYNMLISLLSGIFLCMCPANERQRYNVTLSLIGWAHTQNYPCVTYLIVLHLTLEMPQNFSALVSHFECCPPM